MLAVRYTDYTDLYKGNWKYNLEGYNFLFIPCNRHSLLCFYTVLERLYQTVLDCFRLSSAPAIKIASNPLTCLTLHVS